MTGLDFIHLHTHTGYSFLDGYGLPDQYLDRLEEIGHKSLAITDHGNIWAHVPFWREAQKRNNGTKIIYGCEFYIVDDAHDRHSRSRYHITVLAKDEIGQENIHKLITFSNFVGFYYKPRIDFETLLAHKEGLIVLSGCMGAGVLINNLNNPNYIEQYLGSFKKAFKDDFYIEVSPIEKYAGEVTQMIDLADSFNIEPVSTSDSHFPSPEDHAAEDLLVCIGTKTNHDDPNRLKLMPELYLFDGLEAQRRSELVYPNHVPFDNTLEIEDKCSDKRVISGQKTFPLEKNVLWKNKEEFFLYQIKTGTKFRGLKKLKDWPEYEKRLEKEIRLINEKDYVDYFLVIQDLCVWAKKRMLVGAARGSVAGSLVAYVLRITEVDPIPHGLIFERFIDVTRSDPPDIDLDFPDEKRHLVIEYLIDKYGETYTSQLGTIGYFKPKVALWDTRRVYDLPYKAAQELVNLVMERSSADARASFCLTDTFDQFERSKAIVKQYPLFEEAAKIEGQIKQHGIHAAGVVVSDEPISKIGGLVKGTKGERIISMDKKDSEAVGLLKIDILGLKQLTIIESILELIGKDYDWLYNLPLDDEPTFELFRTNKLWGVFQFEGDAVRMVNRQVRPDSFTNIAEISALARPGSLHCGGTTRYINYRAYEKDFDVPTKTKVQYVHPLLEKLAGDTYGIVVYQEQVLTIMKDLGKMSWADTTAVRKAMSKSFGIEFFNKYKDKFIKGAKENKVEKEIATVIWDNICTFGSWAFNKSHSVSYGLLSYWTAYLKTHHPQEFYISTIRKENEDDKIKKLLREWVDRGFKFEPIDLEKSEQNFTLKDGVIYGGFQNMKGIGEKAADKIVDTRPWSNSADFRKAFGKRGLQSLKVLGRLPTGMIRKGDANQIDLFENITGAVIDTFKDIENPKDVDSITDLLPWADLYPIGEEFRWWYEKYAGKWTLLKDINEKSVEVIVIAKITKLNLRDVFEAGMTQNRDTTKLKDKHLTEFLLMHIEDDTSNMVAGINRYRFGKYKKIIFEESGIGSVIVVQGRKVPGFSKIDITKMKVLKKGKVAE
jgi:DNA polymerase III subunit alpha